MLERARHFEKDWLLGFFGFFALYAIPGLLEGDWIWASWLAWAAWFLFFLPSREEPESRPDSQGSDRRPG